MSAILEVVINGEGRQVPAGLSVIGLVRHLGLAPERVAMA